MKRRSFLLPCFGSVAMIALACGSKAPSANLDAGGAGGSTSEPPTACDDRPQGTPPGPAVVNRSVLGGGACVGQTLGDVIRTVVGSRPDLSDITSLHPGYPTGDGSFIYAYSDSNGGFALIFKRGGGDCPAGCTENEYWYFETGVACAVTEIGHAKFPPPGGCFPPDAKTMWGMPPPLPPHVFCGADMSTHDMSGTYSLPVCGSRRPCLRSGEKDVIEPVMTEVTLVVAQKPDDLDNGTVTLTGSPMPELDGTPIPATFQFKRFTGQLTASNSPSTCFAQRTVTVAYDFDRFGESHVRVDVLDTPNCSMPSDYCKGYLDAVLGPVTR